MNKTGQGSKVCPHSDLVKLRKPHTVASRDDIRERLTRDLDHQISCTSPSQAVFQKTSAYISALRELGCPAQLHERIILSPSEKVHHARHQETYEKKSRGYSP